jgi:DNA-binding CsgD family transcriptional regulator
MLEKVKRHKELLSYAIAMAVLLLLLQWLEFRFLIMSHQYEIYIGIIALLFLFFGIWIANKITDPKIKTVIIEKEIRITQTENFILNEAALQELKISKRELEVLTLMAEGLSNQEIAERLFVSLNTIKTHSSNLFEKLDVKRRTQAIENAKKLQLLPGTLR